MKRKWFLLILLLFISVISKVKAADLTEYFSVNDIEICDDATCSIVYNEENGVNAGNKFLVKFKGELHSQSIINDGDTVTIPFANEPLTENTTSYECTGFSWSDIYDENGDKIGKWQMTGTVTDRKINIKFPFYRFHNHLYNIAFLDIYFRHRIPYIILRPRLDIIKKKKIVQRKKKN